MSLEQTWEQVAMISLQHEAELVRAAAIRLAAEYDRLADRGLDREVAELDVAAVVRAWQAASGARP